MQERSPYNQVEQKGKIMELGWDLRLWEGAVKEEKASAHWEVPSLMRSAGTERGEMEPQRRAQRQRCQGQSQEKPEQTAGAGQLPTA